MSIQTIKLGAAALLAGALLVGEAQAQQAAPAPAAGAPGGAQAQPVDPTKPVRIEMQVLPKTEWTKICPNMQPGAKQMCLTTRDFTTDPNQPAPPPVALAIYDVKGDESRIVRVLMPIGVLLKPGVRLAVDKGATSDGSFEFCMPNGCFAEVRINGKTLEQMKKGTTLNVVAKGLANNEVTFALPLGNFGKSFDGPAIPAEVIQKQQQEQQAELQKQLQERAQAQREAIEKAAAAPAAPAAGAPPAAAPAKP